MTEETTFANEAWKLLRSKGSRPTLQDLVALRPRPKPGSKLDESAVILLTVYIHARTTLGSEEHRIVYATQRSSRSETPTFINATSKARQIKHESQCIRWCFV